MIVVTGATGNVGRPLVQALLDAGSDVTAVSRRIDTAPEGARHVRADLTDPASLVPVLTGASAVFLLTSGEFLAAGDPEKVVDVIAESGVRRVVLLSSQGVGTGRHAPATEQAVARLDATILRAGGFHTNALRWAEQVRTARTVAAPFADVALPTVDPADIAAVAAATLREDGHAGQTYVLTGPEAVSPRAQADAIGDAIGEPVRFVELTAGQAREGMLRFMPAPVVDATLDILGSPLPAEQRVSDDVPRTLGRSAVSFGEWARRNALLFK
ncbi:SDR family oxidoreductase [Actinophytocola oryzae]|uniref:Uncharacterized protein YbjT (DUF2867 family) n=1 Tax=Actinophytocola oryzae TaxID=502181 RepID=A0A4R7VYW8_9PSEU|nr:NAD(P)H-binding protein [Actinophytocola oryzae]TDV55376.1 uncharacterized protein YbjT (DUF2867 family) [Actinophytocola oryzae]